MALNATGYGGNSRRVFRDGHIGQQTSDISRYGQMAAGRAVVVMVGGIINVFCVGLRRHDGRPCVTGDFQRAYAPTSSRFWTAVRPTVSVVALVPGHLCRFSRPALALLGMAASATGSRQFFTKKGPRALFFSMPGAIE
jgi:hypothetical protein